jgi:hypothetical protein
MDTRLTGLIDKEGGEAPWVGPLGLKIRVRWPINEAVEIFKR